MTPGAARWREVNQNGGRLEPLDDRLELKGSTLSGVDLSSLRLEVFRAMATTFDRCDFSRMIVTGRGTMSAQNSATLYRECEFVRADLRAVFPSTARFERCRFEDVRLDGWVCEKAEFVGCVFVGELTDVVFSGTIASERVQRMVGRRENEFRANDFSDATLRYVGFQRGIALDEQNLPSGPEYVIVREFPASLKRAQAAVAEWPDTGPDGERDRAERMLARYAIGRENQEVLFARPDESRAPEVVRRRVWEILGAERLG
jgi:hypothetical protein